MSKKPAILLMIEDTFNQSSKDDIKNNYFPKVKGCKKWMCFSDYALDDKNKPNDVITFTLVPYFLDIEIIQRYIKSIANKDIKNIKSINPEFMRFFKTYPLINFSFVFNKKNKIFGNNQQEQKKSLLLSLDEIKKQYIYFKENEPENSERYGVIIKKIDNLIKDIKNNKKIKQTINMFLITLYGAYVVSEIIKDIEIEKFGWFSDRDAINDLSDMLSIDFLSFYLNGMTNGKKFDFIASPARCTDNPFYEELVRIPDYISGTLADYNMKENVISKEKFKTVLNKYMSGNDFNNFIYKIDTTDCGTQAARLLIVPED